MRYLQDTLRFTVEHLASLLDERDVSLQGGTAPGSSGQASWLEVKARGMRVVLDCDRGPLCLTIVHEQTNGQELWIGFEEMLDLLNGDYQYPQGWRAKTLEDAAEEARTLLEKLDAFREYPGSLTDAELQEKLDKTRVKARRQMFG